VLYARVPLLLVLTALLALHLSQRWPDLARMMALPALLLCMVAGLTLPDLDQPLPLDHRSALTHSIAPALLALARRWARPVAAGLALGLGLHLAADVFPNAMVGFATVKLPFAGSIGSDASYFWLGANALACTALGGWLLARAVEAPLLRLLALLVICLIGVSYLVGVDGGWPALAIYLAAGWFALSRLRPA
jgi:membrane-bound metal-dependent hydrolase YbcI (DUF457 family)